MYRRIRRAIVYGLTCGSKALAKDHGLDSLSFWRWPYLRQIPITFDMESILEGFQAGRQLIPDQSRRTEGYSHITGWQ